MIRTRRYRQLALTLLAAVAMAIAPWKATATTILTVDQQNTTGGSNFGVSPSDAGGQSFTPSMSGIDAVEFSLASQTGTSPTTVNIQLLDGKVGANGLGGTLLATTSSVIVSSTKLATYHFDFSSTVPLTPGQEYVLVIQTSSVNLNVDATNTDPYAGGQVLLSSLSSPTFASWDFVFTTGLHSLPEPSTTLLLGFGLLGLGLRRRTFRGSSRPRRVRMPASLALAIPLALLCHARAEASPISSAILAGSPIGYWQLGEATGATTAIDASGNAADLDYHNGVGLGTAGIQGGGGDTAITFDGVDDYLIDPVWARFAPASSMTVSLWFRPDALQDSFLIGSTGNGDANGCCWRWYAELDAAGTVSFRYWDGNESLIVTSDAYAVGEWNHLAITVTSGGTDKIWLNGVKQSSESAIGATVAWGYLVAGAEVFSGSPQRAYSGALDELAIFDSVLGATTIEGHYAAGLPEPRVFLLAALGAGALATVRWREKHVARR